MSVPVCERLRNVDMDQGRNAKESIMLIIGNCTYLLVSQVEFHIGEVICLTRSHTFLDIALSVCKFCFVFHLYQLLTTGSQFRASTLDWFLMQNIGIGGYWRFLADTARSAVYYYCLG